MRRIVIDIETAGLPWEEWDEDTRAYLVRRSGPQADEEEVRDRLGLSGLTGKVIAIGMMNPDTRKGGVYYEVPGAGEEIEEREEEGIVYRAGSEAGILRMFWKDIERYNVWVTYNGRTFDVPFLMQRSPYRRCDAIEEPRFRQISCKTTLRPDGNPLLLRCHAPLQPLVLVQDTRHRGPEGRRR